MGVRSDISRRGLFRMTLQTVLLNWAAALPVVNAHPLDVDRIASRNVSGTRTLHVRRYRVKASVSLLSIPIFSREDVGAACVMVEELAAGTGRTSAIQFSAGSWPDRIGGFNRFGMTQEVMRHEDGAIAESAYFSFMTRSPEKNDEQAWRAFAEPSREQTLAVARGSATQSSYAFALEHLLAPQGCTWMDCPRLMSMLRDRNGSSPRTAANERTERAYPTFLHAIRSLIAARRRNVQCVFMHNAKLYDLRAALSAADGMQLLTGRIVEHAAEHVTEDMTEHMTEQRASGESNFRVWCRPDDASGLPARIEFRPRSFLRLVFEQDSAVAGPILRCLIPEEKA
jgi:hypothetical protein